MAGVAGRTVLIAGATSAAGAAAIHTLTAAGAHVIAVGRDAAKVAALAPSPPQPAETTASVRDVRGGFDATGWVRREVCDLSDEDAVAALAGRLRGDGVRVDGVLHLVGGWRGGGGLGGQTDADYRFLEHGFTALRHVSRAFDADLRASDAGRLAIVSSTAVQRPLAGGANYAAVKAASEAWTRAVAHGFAKAARDADDSLRAAAVTFRVKALDGLEQALADAFVGLWDVDAADMNDTVIPLA